jgi:hypothetical protein
MIYMREEYKGRSEQQRTPPEQIIEYVESKGFEFNSFVGEYRNSESKISYYCEHGHLTVRSIGSFKRKANCNECLRNRYAFERRNDISHVEELLIERNCRFVSGEYADDETPFEVEFLGCGHTEILSLSNLRYRFSGLCLECSAEEKKKRGRERERIKLFSFLEEHGFKFISFPNGYNKNTSIIEYECEKGHFNSKRVMALMARPICSECRKEELVGDKKGGWKGGITPLRVFLDKRIVDWKKDSAAQYNYRCAITGEEFDDIHHLVSFSSILSETLNELSLQNDTVNGYTQEEINAITELFIEKHYRYGLGIPITRKLHILFHKLYGQDGSTTPEDFYDFVDRINSGEIQIPN